MPKRASSNRRYDYKRSKRNYIPRRRIRNNIHSHRTIKPFAYQIVKRRGVCIRSTAVVLNTTAGNGTSEAFEFHAGHIADHLVMGNLYDHYRIKKVHVTYWIEESGDVVPSERIDWDKYNFTMVCKTDHDDNSPRHYPLLTLDPNASFFNIVKDKQYHWTLYPKPAVNIYNGTLTSDGHGVGSGRTWLDCTNSSIPHYGFKWAFNGYGEGSPVAPLQVSFRMMYDMEYKSPKHRAT